MMSRTRLSFAAALCLTSACFARDRIALLPAAASQFQGVTLDTQHTAGGDVTFVKGFTNGPERVVFTFDAAAGLYEAHVRYRAGGFKGYTIDVNGLQYGGTMAQSGDAFAQAAPLRVLLTAGRNTLALGGGWGHYDIAGVELVPVDVPPPPKAPPGGLSDPLATTEAKALYARLVAGYGKTTLSGIYADEDIAYVREKTGKTPAILGADLSDYSPTRVEHGAKPQGIAPHLVEQAGRGLVLTLSWHWNAPSDLIDNAGKTDDLPPKQRWYMGFYKEASTYDFAKAINDPNGDGYKLLLRDIDAVAGPLKQLQDANVPVLWRPLHEAEGGWFWWGTKGPENYVKLWRLVHERLTRTHGLHNLIWVFTAGQDLKWYPGDDVVDVVGVDNYPKDNRDPLVSDWQTVLTQFGRRKLLALSEFGFVPDLDFARQHGVYWAYYNTWNGDNGPKNLPVGELKRRFASPLSVAKENK